jgi:hypothetical protein
MESRRVGFDTEAVWAVFSRRLGQSGAQCTVDGGLKGLAGLGNSLFELLRDIRLYGKSGSHTDIISK